MDRSYYLDLAARGARIPIGAHLVLHEEPDPDAARRDPVRLGRVIERAARRFSTTLAFPLMDLEHSTSPETPEYQASLGAVRYIAEQTSLRPVGMVIGPFSLATKLVKDPITPVALAGRGVTAAEDESVAEMERCREMALSRVLSAASRLLGAGARAIMVCEPAASIAYFSPRQLRSGANIFTRYVLEPNLDLRRIVADAGADLIFHDCGELTPEMVKAFGHTLHPVILSLGSSRKLWEDSALVPRDVVLYGNLPSKSFYSDAAMPDEEVRRRTVELLARMKECGHPFILGSECDVLHVDGADEAIRRKVRIMLESEP